MADPDADGYVADLHALRSDRGMSRMRPVAQGGGRQGDIGKHLVTKMRIDRRGASGEQ